jgi:hypothetical protein
MLRSANKFDVLNNMTIVMVINLFNIVKTEFVSGCDVAISEPVHEDSRRAIWMYLLAKASQPALLS